MEESCEQCGKQGVALRRCARCKQASYCGLECQKAGWKNHKTLCAPPLSKARATENIRLLWEAVGDDHVDEVKRLLADGVNPEERGIGACTPMHVASEEGLLKIVEVLIQHRADVSATDLNGATPLHGAASEGYGEV
ncbi:ankyrin repeat-containing domain protein, partial [Baffinella frigidus]